MKLISIFLLFSMFLYANDALTLPKCIKYESTQKVIENDWSYASKRIKKFMEHNATAYVDTFMKLVDKPLILKTDEEYIEEQIMHHKEFLNNENLMNSMPVPIESMDEYSQRVKKEVKYKVYSFERYKHVIEIVDYRMIYVYIRYLEYHDRYQKAFELYEKIAKRFLSLYNKKQKNFFNLIVLNMRIDEYLKALTKSLESDRYTKVQKKILYDTLSRFLVDKDLFIKMLIEEKKTIWKILAMTYLDENSSAESIMKDEMFFKSISKIIEEENLKKHLNNIEVRQAIVNNFKKDMDSIYTKLINIKSKEEYKEYDKMMEDITNKLSYIELGRLWLLSMSDDLKYDKLSKMFRYKFTKDKFIDYVCRFYSYFGKPWIWGKYKFEFEDRYEKSIKFLELLKKG